MIFNPHGKTRASRRNVLISERMFDLLMLRCAGKTEGWLFPSKRAASGHLPTVAKQFREARLAAGLPNSLVLYNARHTFGTAVYEATGNLALVMKAMGHSDGSQRCPHCDALSASGARFVARSHRSAQSTSQFTSQ